MNRSAGESPPNGQFSRQLMPGVHFQQEASYFFPQR
jgi:hypothetical protein